ncbi:MAG: hypothetical protein ABI193_13500, partial [Minicystis sp.]
MKGGAPPSRQRWELLVALLGVALIGVVLVVRARREQLRAISNVPVFSTSAPPSQTSSSALSAPSASAPPLSCGPGLSRAESDESLALGTSFLLHAQKPEGNFTYLYAWRTRAVGAGDNGVRQAGAAWALALLHRDRPTPETAAAVERALGFFERISRLTPEGHRYLIYPGDAEGSLGAVALVALAHIDYLLSGATSPKRRAQLDEFLAMLRAAESADGRFVEAYDHEDGRPIGEPSPYVEGEALLAFVKAARFLGRADLRAPALLAAERGHLANIVNARSHEADSTTIRAYFQWSLMSYQALFESGWPGTERYADDGLALADWMIDVRGLGHTNGNEGYALEGLAAAHALARARGDAPRAQRIRCAVIEGLRRLTRWQV